MCGSSAVIVGEIAPISKRNREILGTRSHFKRNGSCPGFSLKTGRVPNIRKVSGITHAASDRLRALSGLRSRRRERPGRPRPPRRRAALRPRGPPFSQHASPPLRSHPLERLRPPRRDEDGHEEACAAAIGRRPASIGVDTWGVDFGLLARDGSLLGLPFCYRDHAHAGRHGGLFQARAPREALYEATGIQFMPFNTLFQLYAMVRDRSPRPRRGRGPPLHARPVQLFPHRREGLRIHHRHDVPVPRPPDAEPGTPASSRPWDSPRRSSRTSSSRARSSAPLLPKIAGDGSRRCPRRRHGQPRHGRRRRRRPRRRAELGLHQLGDLVPRRRRGKSADHHPGGPRIGTSPTKAASPGRSAS